jgi:uncharacterized membrane protein YraQ (UPF0718 family)/copper chaperone CopZ
MLPTLLALADASWSVLLELAPWLLLGAVVAGLLHGLVPPDLVQRALRGPGGVVRAVLLGIPLPLCSCGVIPAGIGLQKSGASRGASVGFLIATPQTGVDSIAVSAGFLGWPFALYKVGAALITGLVGGLLVEAVDPGAEQREDVAAGHADRSIRGMVAHSVDVVRMIWGWLLFGVLVSAALTVFLPAGGLGSLVGGSAVVGVLLVLLASLPLYVCATASVPIAAALVAAGLPTGAALVFLMAGPATNVATLGAVWRAFGRRALAGYLGTIIVGSVGLGLAYEPLLGRLVASGGHGHEHTAWWAQVSAGLLLLSFGWFAIEDVRARVATWRAKQAAARAREIPIGGMTCKGCAARLQRVVGAHDGVETATVSFDTGLLVLTGEIQPAALREVVEGAGFSVES